MTDRAGARVEARIVNEEHRRLRVGVAMLEDTIEHAHSTAAPALIDRLHRVIQWMRRDFAPHTAWEDAWLYPALDRAAGTPWATRLLRFQHVQIAEVARQLELDAGVLRQHTAPEPIFTAIARMALLHGLLAAHLAQEERFAIPLLDGEPAS
jgi:hypothetical protein